MPSASCDIDMNANGITLPSCTSFQLSFSIPLAQCDANTGADGIICTKSHVSLKFDHCDLINAVVPFTKVLEFQGYV